jgi:hypothetical protein
VGAQGEMLVVVLATGLIQDASISALAKLIKLFTLLIANQSTAMEICLIFYPTRPSDFHIFIDNHLTRDKYTQYTKLG